MVRILILLLGLIGCACRLPLMPRAVDREPIVVITFDDGSSSIYTYAFPTMRSLEPAWAATHFLPVDFIGASGNVTLEQLQEMESAGWETGGHGLIHENLSSVPLDSAEKQLAGSYAYLAANGLSHESFAYAWGNYDDEVRDAAERYFVNLRTAHDLTYADGVNRAELGYFAVKAGHSAQDIINRVEQARANGWPLVVIGFHAILPDSSAGSPYYWCKESTFKTFLEYLKREELQVTTIKRAMEMLEGER